MVATCNLCIRYLRLCYFSLGSQTMAMVPGARMWLCDASNS
jgi:hypothetical protein